MKKLFILAVVLMLCCGCAEALKVIDGIFLPPSDGQPPNPVQGGLSTLAYILFGTAGTTGISVIGWLWSVIRGRKAIGLMATAIEAKRAPEGQNNAADEVAAAIKEIANPLINKIVAKVTK